MKSGLKIISYTFTHFTVAFAVAWILTGSALIGGLIALVEPIFNTLSHYIQQKKSRNQHYPIVKV